MAESFQFPAFGGMTSKASQWFLDAGVPVVLFWNGMKTAYTGEPSSSAELQEVQFIVPDHLLDTAADALVRAGFQLCSKGHACRLAKPQGQGPLPDEHFHNGSGQTLMLLEKSQFLWAVPDFPLDPVKFDDPCFMNSDDPRLETSKHHLSAAHSDPYRILTPGCLVESLLHLAARDYQTPWTYRECWLKELKWIVFKYPQKGRPIRECQVTPLMWPFVHQVLQIEKGENFQVKVDRVLKTLQQTLYDNDVIPPLLGVVGSVLLDP